MREDWEELDDDGYDYSNDGYEMGAEHNQLESMEGFNIVDGDGNTEQKGFSEADKFLADPVNYGKDIGVDESLISELQDLEGQRSLGSLTEGDGYDLSYGAASAKTRQLDRFSHMEERVRAYAKQLIENPTLTGQRSKHKEVTALSAQEAVLNFGKIIGEDPMNFANLLKIPLGVNPTSDKYEQKMVQGMLGVTAEVRELEGPGSKLTGHTLNPSQLEKQEEDLNFLLNRLPEIADLYIMEGTKKKDPELHKSKRDEVEIALYKYLSSSHKGQRVIESSTGLTKQRQLLTASELELKYANTSIHDRPSPLEDLNKYTTEDIYASTIVPLPNELNVFGLIRTENTPNGDNTFGGTPYTRKEYEELFPSVSDLTAGGTSEWEYEVYKESEAAKFSAKQLDALAPNPKRTFFKSGIYGKEESTRLWKDLNKDMKRLSKIIRSRDLTAEDEFWGNTLRSSSLPKSEEHRDSMEYWNEAAELDLGSYMDIYSNESMSQSDIYGELRKEGLSKEEAYMEVELQKAVGVGRVQPQFSTDFIGPIDLYKVAKEGITNREVDSIVDEVELTDRDKYKEQVRLNLLSGTYHKQGTDEWKAQREGLITATAAYKITSKTDKIYGQQAMADRITSKEPFISNANIKEGQRWETKAKASFEAKTGLNSEEAYFDINPELEGFGVSPDGYVFDKYGNSQGLAEFKVHELESTMAGGLKRYTNQMQMQMAVTGQDKVHFYRINKETNTYSYNVIERDEAVIDQLLEGGREVLKLVEDIKNKESTTGGPDLARTELQKTLEKAKEDKKATAFKEKVKSKVEGATVYGKAPNIMNSPEAFTRKPLPEVASNANLGQISKEELENESKRKLREEDKHNKELRDLAIKYRKEEASEAKELSRQKKKDAGELSQAFDKLRSNFTKGLKGSIGVIRDGASSAGDDMRLASASGMDAERLRGMKWMLQEEGGLTEPAANNVMNQAANLSTQWKPGVGGAEAYTRMEEKWRSMAGTSGVSLGSYPEIRGMSQADLVAHMHSKLGSVAETDKEAASALGKLVGMEDLLMAKDNVSANDLKGAWQDIDKEGMRASYKGQARADHDITKFKEGATNLLGETGNYGMTIAGAMTDGLGLVAHGALVVANSKALAANTIALAMQGKGGLDYSKGGKSKGGVIEGIKNLAKKAAPIATKAGGLITAAATSGAGIMAASAAGVGVAGYAGYKLGEAVVGEDGIEGVNDFVWDTMSMIPGTDAYETEHQEDLVSTIPTPNIGNIQAEPILNKKDKKEPIVVDNNLTVSVLMEEDGVLVSTQDAFGNNSTETKQYNEE